MEKLRKQFLFIISMVWFFLAAPAALALVPGSTLSVILSSEASTYDVTPLLSYFEDLTDQHDITTIRTPEVTAQFAPLPSTKIQRGYVAHPHWLKFTIENKDPSRSKWFLYFTSSELAICDFYMIDGKKISAHYERGYLSAAVDLSGLPRQPFVELNLAPNASRTIYVKVRSNNFLGLTLNVVDQAAFTKLAYLDTLFYGLFFGCVMALLLYNLCLFIALRDRLYLLYAVFVAILTLNIATVSGFMFIAFPQLKGMDWSLMLGSMRTLVFVTAIQFSRLFLQAPIYAPRLNKVILGLTFFMIAKLLASIAAPVPEWLSDEITSTPIALLIIATGIISYRQGYKPASPFMIAWICLFASVIVWSFSHLGFIEPTYLIANAPLIGSMLELILMSLALGQRYNMLREADHKASLEKHEKQRLSNLVRVLCHDIANPLAVIQGTSRIALGKATDLEKHVRLWQKIERASQILHEMIDQIRHMEAYNSGKVKPAVEPVSLKETFNNMLFIFDARSRKKGIDLSHNLTEGIKDIYVLADKIMLGNNVINNIISNAIKFSLPGGKIVVEACVDDDERVHVMIRDYGIGMPTSLISKLFDPSAETSRLGTQHEGGTGFGMPLVKSVTESLAGVIEIESKDRDTSPDDHGTTVHIYLPLYRPPMAAGIDSYEKH